MPQHTKIATCCYCGTRAALVLGGTATRHELSCASCGAPLHDMKKLHAPEAPAPYAVSHQKPARTFKAKVKKAKKTKKKQKGRFSWVLEEVFDAIEDVFD